MIGDGSICTVRIDVLSGILGIYMAGGLVDKCRVSRACIGWTAGGSLPAIDWSTFGSMVLDVNLGLWVICNSCEAICS